MKKLFIAVTMVAIMLGATASMFAQAANTVSVPVGQIIICFIIVNPSFISVSVGPGANGVTGNGNASFRSIATQAGPTAGTVFTPVTLNFNGSDPVYGQFNFAFDGSRPPTPTTVRANQPGPSFPATSNIYANVTGTVSALPGTYENINQLHLTTSNLQTFNPHVREVYTVAEDCVFHNPNDDNAPTFTIPAGSQVTLN